MNQGTATIKARTAARYAEVRHLPHAVAAKLLGVTESAVKDYRKHHPDARPDGYGIKRKAAPPPRPAVNHDKRVVEVISGPAFSSADAHVARVSVSREPWSIA